MYTSPTPSVNMCRQNVSNETNELYKVGRKKES